MVKIKYIGTDIWGFPQFVEAKYGIRKYEDANKGNGDVKLRECYYGLHGNCVRPFRGKFYIVNLHKSPYHKNYNAFGRTIQHDARM